MHANPHDLAAPSPLSSLFAELDTKLNQALSDASSLEPSQWQDVSRRLNRLRGLLSQHPTPPSPGVHESVLPTIDASFVS